MAVSGYRIAMLVSGGAVLIIADQIGFQLTYALMILFMGIGLFATKIADEPDSGEQAPFSFQGAFVAPLREFISRRNAYALLIFLVLYKLGDAFAGSLTTAFFTKRCRLYLN